MEGSCETGGGGLGACLQQDSGGSGLGFLLPEPVSGAGRGCVISWLKSRLSAVTLLASLGTGRAGKRVGGRVRGGRAGREGPVPKGWLPLGRWFPVPQAPSALAWSGQGASSHPPWAAE